MEPTLDSGVPDELKTVLGLEAIKILNGKPTRQHTSRMFSSLGTKSIAAFRMHQ